MRKISVITAFLILSICFSAIALSAEPSPRLKLLTVDGQIINPVTAEYILRGLHSAEADNVPLVIALDTPGGLLASTQTIVKEILQSPVPVIVFIQPQGARAGSAGVFISYASHILAMSPSTRIGAAHPIIGGGSWGELDEEVKNKIMKDTLAWAKNIAETRKRPFTFIQETIEESTSFTVEQAQKAQVCDIVAKDLQDLIKQLNGLRVETPNRKIVLSTKNAYVEEIELSKREKLLNALIHPNIAYLLLTLGFLGLVFESTHPGFGFPGIAGLISLLIAFYALSILPVNYTGVTLLVLGIIFFVVEAFTPTFGLFTLGGVIAFVLGSTMLFNQPGLLKVSLNCIIPIVATLALLSSLLLGKAIATMRMKPAVGRESFIGQIAEALKPFNAHKKGVVFVNGTRWTARSTQNIKKGQEVRIIKMQGLVLWVEPKKEVSDA